MARCESCGQSYGVEPDGRVQSAFCPHRPADGHEGLNPRNSPTLLDPIESLREHLVRQGYDPKSFRVWCHGGPEIYVAIRPEFPGLEINAPDWWQNWRVVAAELPQ